MKASYDVDKDGKSGYLIFCPACRTAHFFDHTWRFNWDMERPTLQPSLRIVRADGSRCHSNVRDGMIAFCEDSTHELSGQVVPLPDVPWG